MTSHQLNHQDTHSTTTSKRKSVRITPKIQVRYKFNQQSWQTYWKVLESTPKTGTYANPLDGSEKFINFYKIPQLILDKKSTNSDNLKYETNLNNISNNTVKEKCQQPELVEQQIPEGNIANKILLSQNKEQELQAKLTELDQWKVRKVYDELDDRG